jgi:hypothetical protein
VVNQPLAESLARHGVPEGKMCLRSCIRCPLLGNITEEPSPNLKAFRHIGREPKSLLHSAVYLKDSS